MARSEPGGQALAQIRHGIGTGDAERLEAETARARLDGLAQGAAREDDLFGFQKSRSA
jgi:hypothetical protein